MLDRRIAMVCAALIVLLAAPLLAQSPPGKITGTVKVASGAPVGGAAVTITNQETGATRVVRTVRRRRLRGGRSPAGPLHGVGRRAGLPQGDPERTSGSMPARRSPSTSSLELKIAEDVTVTAMKREETVDRARPSPSRRRPKKSCGSAASRTSRKSPPTCAGFTVQNLGPGQSQVAMRGVSSGQIARDQPGVKEQVGAYLDESVISLSLFTPDIDLFDMNRVEVLRGPQGTLFGSGSLSAARSATSATSPSSASTTVFGEFGGERHHGGGNRAATSRWASTCRWAAPRPCASPGTTTGSPATWTPCSRT